MRAAPPTPSRREPDWRTTAPCKDDADAMFPSAVSAEIEYAKSFCRRCPAIERCRDWALTTREIYGVWGGLTEDERWEIFRQKPQPHRAAQPPGPRLSPPDSLGELFARHANPSTGGHLMWTGAKTPIYQGRQFTPGQVAFIADRGRNPEGLVQRTCEVRGCVQPAHLEDDTERQRCGTRPGYNRHRRNGEVPCADCRRANADADNRLRRTGTTKVAV
ncbi:WhiB family transcriptional regulator [Streptomyces stelliscabiei]|uniref:WhiB family transcriptional regulator n=1 Tax=Streptomyces stelliscabiei TaxID=146820 RepID=UPI002FF38C3B